MATSISVTNASFETIPGAGLTFACGTGCSYSLDATPGWSGGQGQFRPGTDVGNFAFFNTLSAGPTSAFSNGGTPFTQTVGTTVVAGVTYTLVVDIGDRNDSPGTGVASLMINGNSYVATGALLDGGWAPFTVNYLGTALDAGQAITIVLASGGSQANFDNVRLSDSTGGGGGQVPEPATVTLLGLGLLGMAAGTRRARKSAQN